MLHEMGIPDAGNIQYESSGPMRCEMPNHLPSSELSTPALDLNMTQSYRVKSIYSVISGVSPVIFSSGVRPCAYLDPDAVTLPVSHTHEIP